MSETLDLDGIEARAKRAVEWGVVYDAPEEIVALVAEVRRLQGTIDDSCGCV